MSRTARPTRDSSDERCIFAPGLQSRLILLKCSESMVGGSSLAGAVWIVLRFGRSREHALKERGGLDQLADAG